MSQDFNTQEISPELQEKINTLADAIMRGETTAQEALNITEEQLEAMYAVGYNLFVNEKYQDALTFFAVLQNMAPLNYKMVFGSASCLQKREKYAEAILTYTFASGLEPNNPAPMLHLAECYMIAEDVDAAKYSLELAIERCDESSFGNAVRARAEIMLENMGE